MRSTTFVLLSVPLALTACPGPGDTGAIADFVVVDACDGQREFLDIAPGADLLFTAGIYAEAPYPDGLNAPTEIYALDLDDLEIHRVSCSNFAEARCHHARPQASPDGGSVAVMRACSDTTGDGMVNYLDTTELRVIDLSTDEIVEVSGFASVNAPDWSMDDRILFAANLEGQLNTDIYTMDPDGSNMVNLTETDELIENDPAWSHDGDRIVYAMGEFVEVAPPEGQEAWVAARGSLWLMDADGGGAAEVVSYGGDGCEAYSDHYCLGLPVDPDFYPDGDRIAYSQLLSVEENSGSGRWNVFSASTSGLDQDVQNLTQHPTAYQDIVRISERGLLFHEVDAAADPPYFGLVLTDQEGGSRQELLNSEWNYYIGPGHWL